MIVNAFAKKIAALLKSGPGYNGRSKAERKFPGAIVISGLFNGCPEFDSPEPTELDEVQEVRAAAANRKVPASFITFSIYHRLYFLSNGGEGEIRTPGCLATTFAFQANALDHYATSPGRIILSDPVLLSKPFYPQDR